MKSNGALTTQEVAARFHELAQQEKWFEIQDELFAEHVRSIEPPTANGLPNAQGKAAVRKMTMRGAGRVQMNEVMVYEVKDGQIVLEQFFY